MQYKNILIVNLMYLGDLLFMSPVLRTLRANYPDAKISFLVDKKIADVVKFNPNIDEVIAIDKKGYHNKFLNYWKFVGEIRKHKFDLVINFHPNERASAIAAFSGAKRIVGLSCPLLKPVFHKLVNHNNDIHQVDAYLEVLKDSVEINQVYNNGLEMFPDENYKESSERIWKEYFQDESVKVIGINTGGSWKTKRWTKKGFSHLADMLLEQGYGVVFFGGPMDLEDVTEINSLMKNSAHKNLAILTGKINLSELAFLMKKCQVVVTGDSGPMHVAVSQGVPVVSIFGPSDAERYFPYGQKENVIKSDLDCLGCGSHACEHHSCMKNLAPETIFKILNNMFLNNNKNT